MNSEPLLLASLAILAVSFLYSAVGQAGASGYIAVMALFSFAPSTLKPTALVLTILVAAVGAFQFWRAGHFSWSIFWPFALLSIPAAFIGGYLDLPPHIFKVVLGLLLLYSAGCLCLRPAREQAPSPPPLAWSLPIGAGLGLVAGLTGTGGGIFLGPLLIFRHWSTVKTASALSTMFILVNSLAGLLGHFSGTPRFSPFALILAVAAGIGGILGSYIGSRRLSPAAIKRLMAVVLTVAGAKLLLT